MSYKGNDMKVVLIVDAYLGWDNVVAIHATDGTEAHVQTIMNMYEHDSEYMFLLRDVTE
jgi:hypothetical protein